MSVVSSDQVVKICFIQELPPVDMIEESCESCKRGNSEESELNTVPGEEALLRYNCLIWASFSDEFLVTINKEIEYKAIHDRIYLEVDA